MWDHTDERIQAHSCAGNSLPQSGLYVLKHKDLEKGAVLVMEEKGHIRMKREGSILYIGESPQLIVDLETQENYIRTGERMLAYRREVLLSPDLLAGKRPQVLETALEYYYRQACETAEGIRIAEEYGKQRMRETAGIRETP